MKLIKLCLINFKSQRSDGPASAGEHWRHNRGGRRRRGRVADDVGEGAQEEAELQAAPG